jgi:hypothetical protein
MVKMPIDHARYEKIAVVVALMDQHLKTLTASKTGVA